MKLTVYFLGFGSETREVDEVRVDKDEFRFEVDPFKVGFDDMKPLFMTLGKLIGSKY